MLAEGKAQREIAECYGFKDKVAVKWLLKGQTPANKNKNAVKDMTLCSRDGGQIRAILCIMFI